MNWFDWLKIRPKGPKFDPRPELSNPQEPDNTKIEESIIVEVNVADFEKNVFGRSHVINGQLHMDFDIYLEEVSSKPENEPIKERQRLQTALHEMMHIMLWKRKDITHLANPKSLIYYMVTGDNIVPTTEDLELARQATSLTPKIVFKIGFDINKYPQINLMLVKAIAVWNSYLGKTFFEVL